MFCTYPLAQPLNMFPMAPAQSSETKEQEQPPLPWRSNANANVNAQLPWKASKDVQPGFQMPGPLEQFRMMQQLQQLQMLQLAMQQNLVANAAAKSAHGWLSEPERARQARDFVELKRILFELSDDDQYVDIKAAEAAVRERDPDIFTRTNKRTFQELIIQANKVGVPVSWLDETRSPDGKERLRLTLPATHYIALVKLLMKGCTDDEPRGMLSGLVAGQLRAVDPGFWSRRPIYKGAPLELPADKSKRATFKLRVLEAQRMGAPIKWTGEAMNYSWVGLEW